MGEKTQTLEGLRTRSIRGVAIRACEKLVEVPLKSLRGETMYRCAEFVDEDAGPPSESVGRLGDLSVFQEHGSVEVPTQRKRGRPKGTTVKAGAKRPETVSCDRDTVHWKPVKRFKRKGNPEVEQRCRCGTRGNHNYLPDEVCERLVGPKPR